MAYKISLKNSGTSTNTPSSLEHGELAINYADGKIFYKNSSNAIVEFTTSGSFLPLSGGTLTGNLSLGDNVKANFGTSNDLEIYHSGSDSFIDDTGTGNLYIRSNSINLQKYTAENMITALADGAVTLYHDNSAKIATTASGISISNDANFSDNGKAIFGASGDLKIFHDGTSNPNASMIEENGTGNLVIKGSNLEVRSSTDELYAQFVQDGVSKLYCDNAQKLSTKSDGVLITGEIQSDSLDVNGNGDISGNLQVHGNLTVSGSSFLPSSGGTLTGNLSLGDNISVNFGANSDLQIYHDGSNSIISETATGNLILRGTNLSLQSDDNDHYIQCVENGAVTLYHQTGGNSSPKIETTSSGASISGNITVTGTVDGRDVATDGTKLDGIESSADVTDVTNVTAAGALMTTGGTVTGNISFGDSNKLLLGASNDLQIYHDTNNSIIEDSGTGNLKLICQDLEVVDQSTNKLFSSNSSAETIFFAAGSDEAFKVKNAGVEVIGRDLKVNDIKEYTSNHGVEIDGTTVKDGGITLTGDLNFGESNKAIFNTNFEIYRDASNSIISETGAGSLILRGTNLSLQSDDNDQYLQAIENGGVTLYHQSGGNSSPKLVTTATGIDVTGSAKITGSASANTSAITMGFTAPDGQIKVKNSTGSPASNLDFYTTNSSGATTVKLGILANGGISISTGNVTMDGTLIGVSALGMGGAITGATSVQTDSIIEKTAANGVSIDGVVLKDGAVTATGELEGASLNINGNGDISGRLGLGTSSPSKLLHLAESADGTKLRITRGGVCEWDFSIGSTSTLSGVGSGALEILPQNGGTANELAIGTAGSTTALVHVTTSGTTFSGSVTASSYVTSSDARLKDNIEDAKDSGHIIDKIKVRQFDWKKTGKHQDYGMIAQELILECPDAVSTPTEDHQMMGVDYSKLVPLMMNEIQQLRARVQTLEKEK